MPILSSIGRRRPAVRLMVAGMYLVLVTGAATMIYPFLLMLAGSTKSAVDLKSWRIIPAFVTDDAALYRKHIEALFNESIEALLSCYPTPARTFEQLDPPRTAAPQWVGLWQQFLQQHAGVPWASSCGHIASPISKTTPSNLRAFRQYVRDRVGRMIEDVNRAWDTDFPKWTAVYVRPENYLLRVRVPGTGPFERTFFEFKQTRPIEDFYFLLPDLYWQQCHLPMLYTRDIEEFNRRHGTSFTSYANILLPPTPPSPDHPLRADWERFVRYTLNILWIRVDSSAAEEYRRYLRARYAGNLTLLNMRHGASYEDWNAISLPVAPPLSGLPLSDWTAWIEGWRDPATGEEYRAPTEALRISSISTDFRDYLSAHFSSLEALNEYAGTTFRVWDEIWPPQDLWHYEVFKARRSMIRREFLLRNFKAVVDHLAVHGRGIWNTAVYSGLSVLLALLVNPAAAYALSRFRLRINYRILFLLLLPMAFPPMITQIPIFLMLRRLDLLNTFAALLLPTLANGYSIFLLKGFFDSLPRELYETAQLDGAGEWTMFWHITMALSKPILAVVALQAFTQAYSNFLYALLICQDERMWTLMVWIYQLQERSGMGVINASLIVAAIPMLLAFLFCQRVILRGLVIPVER